MPNSGQFSNKAYCKHLGQFVSSPNADSTITGVAAPLRRKLSHKYELSRLLFLRLRINSVQKSDGRMQEKIEVVEGVQSSQDLRGILY